MQHRMTSINKDNLNEICSSIANIFSSSAKQSFGNNFAPTVAEGSKPQNVGLGHSVNGRGESVTSPAEFTRITLRLLTDLTLRMQVFVINDNEFSYEQIQPQKPRKALKYVTKRILENNQ